MYIFNRDQFKPSNEDLEKCSRVIADGNVHNPKLMRDWTREHCVSFVWWELLDMSDSSYWTGPDDCVIFYFADPKDATAFSLKWL